MKQKKVKKGLKKHFRVAIFGSARIKRGDKWYKIVKALSKELAKENIDIVTGGGPGLMDAASRGHHSARKRNAKSIGLAIHLPHEQHFAYHLDLKKQFHRFSKRLDTFMNLADVVIVAPGGVGTLLEFFYTWQLVQVKQLCDTPIILLGNMWPGLLTWLKKEPLRKKLMNKTDFNSIFTAKTCKDAITIIKRVKEDFESGAHPCRNFEKYKN
ncbi:hypothetical protein COV18_05525 [Candidatus Woesearchaeota archaeon CG10_big_fil_rev_8_21_14_0_10_37_12]|nr:MAG: hypothetical protein COV18_05525 [Candidatus Woesearchaeota archaeon CG10_big_fil_rev_8_21_14_0_10_37_12]